MIKKSIRPISIGRTLKSTMRQENKLDSMNIDGYDELKVASSQNGYSIYIKPCEVTILYRLSFFNGDMFYHISNNYSNQHFQSVLRA